MPTFEEAMVRRNILVSVQMDEDGRNLIDYTIENIARPDDRVVVVHVYGKSDISNSSILSLAKSLDKYLSEFETLSAAKEISLVGRLVFGKSIKKSLVKEVGVCNATIVVVGINKNSAFRGSNSLAKYCAKKIPATVSLFAVHGQKVVFERESNKPSSATDMNSSLGAKSLSTLFMNSEATIPESKRLNTHELTRKKLTHSDSISNLIETLPEPTSGWPLLRRTESSNFDPSRDLVARKMSVVQWAMSLPRRTQPTQLNSDVDHNDPTESKAELLAYPELREKLADILQKNSSNCRRFTRAELELATNQFGSDNLTGKGGCSKVYIGNFQDGMKVAVKVTKLTEETFRCFLLEADIITTINHESIVPLIGVGVGQDELISVYNFVSRGNLEENLHGRRAKPPLPWDIRFKVAIKIAEALCYLHDKSPRPIIHRDIKSSNILLHDDFEAQLSDFGLAMWAPEDSSGMTQNDVFGTFGYLAPEYFMYGKVSEKIDVYSFGVVLLELLTGRRPIQGEGSKNQESLVMWVSKMLEQGDVMGILDPTLDPNCNADQLQRMVLAATVCIRRIARLRPTMRQVLSLLKGEEDIESWTNSHKSDSPEGDIHEQDEEVYPPSTVASHIGLALQDVDDVTSTSSSTEHSYQNLVEEYLKGRCSRSSSFD